MNRYAWMTFCMIVAAGTAGCQQWAEPDPKQEAHDRWSEVRAELKYQLASDRYKNGHLDEAHESVREAIGLNPKAQEPYVLLTRILIERGEIALAAETLSESLTYGADTAETDYLSGVVADRYRRFDDALKWYQKASTRNTMNAHYVAAVAETLVSLDRASEALDLVKERWVDFEQNATLRALAGGIYTMLGKYEEAAMAYRQAHRISPDDPLLGFQLGSALTMGERYEEGLEVLTGAIENAKFVPASVWLMFGQCQLASGQRDEAKRTFQRIVTEDPNNVHGWDWLARASLTAGDLLTARRAATQTVQLSAGNRDHLTLLGYVCYRQRDYKSAIESLKNAVRGDEQEPIALCLLGQSYAAAGEAGRAEECYRQALKVDPNCEWARQLLEAQTSTASADADIGLFDGGIGQLP